MAEGERKRELALPPGTYEYVLDSTKGVVKLYTGPTVINQTGQDRPVVFNPKTFVFDEVTLEGGMRQNIVVPEGFYAVLTNPSKDKSGKMVYPQEGQQQLTPELMIGLKENIPGPISFALFPGQTCEVRRGHHLRSNEYIRIKIYNEDKAKENWAKAVIKTTEITDPNAKSSSDPSATTVATKNAPADLAVGKQYNILGTEVAFYIPPTGVSVVPEWDDNSGKAAFVRQAETLEQLEYAILVDEDGNKAYPRGPMVVFPRPTQNFLTDQKGNRKFRAIEMNELQGIQLKFITDVSLVFADGTAHKYSAGEEVFITGKEMPIYYPEEGHQLVKYDGKTIHYAVAVPEGEARYVMDRKTGEIRTVTGPTMLLPNPVTEIIVRRALSDGESVTWFPGSDGNGSQDALTYNRWLRNEATKEPTTRQGVVSEGRASASGGAEAASFLSNSIGMEAVEMAAAMYAAPSSAERGGGVSRRQASNKALMAESRQGKQQEAMLGDVAERKSSFNEPRMLTFANKYKGVPTIRVQQGYAVQVADADGNREVVVGPKTVLLEWGQALDVLALSTGKPKNTDKLFRTAYLNIYNNAVTDIIELETFDLVKVRVKLSYRVNFEGDSTKWFSIENYVKHMCDRIRSRLKGQVHKLTIEAFYKNATDIIRDSILGAAATGTDGKGRPGLVFAENGMRVSDVEVLGVEIADPQIGQLLAQAQHQVVQQNIQLAQAKSRLDMTKQTEEIVREEAEAKSETSKRKLELQALELAESLKFQLAQLDATLTTQAAARKTKEQEQSLVDFMHEQALGRERETFTLKEEIAQADAARFAEQIKLQTQAIIDQMKAVEPQLVAALDSVTARETLVKVAEKLSFHQMFGSDNAVEFVQKVFAGTPLQALMAKALSSAGQLSSNGNGSKSVMSPA